MMSGKTLSRMGLGPVWRLRSSGADEIVETLQAEAPAVVEEAPQPARQSWCASTLFGR